MAIFAISDPHLFFATPEKDMALFGDKWFNHPERLKMAWCNVVNEEDLVLIAGDISWGKRWEEAIEDLSWIDRLPGTKLLLRGNHDYWWPSRAQLQKKLPPSLRAISNDSFLFNDVAIGGTRLWDTTEYGFANYIDVQPSGKNLPSEMMTREEDEKIFQRELSRLEISLATMPSSSRLRIAMTHYPPIGADLAPSRTSAILERYKIDICLFGHIHNVCHGSLPFGSARGVRYLLTASDYLDHTPLRIV